MCVCVSKAEMEKAADMTDKSVLFVSAGANFWALSAENYDCRVLQCDQKQLSQTISL